jgi:hypothetical protein
MKLNRTIPIMSILSLGCLVMLVFVLCAALPCNAEQTAAPNTKPYPDSWYRSFDRQGEIFDMFFSDPDVWGDEPVVILVKDKTDQVTAIGFFTGKTEKAFRVFHDGACSVRQGYQYYYAKNKRKMTRKYLPPQNVCSVVTSLSDGDELATAWDMTLLKGEMEKGLIPEEKRLEIRADVKSKSENSIYATIGGIGESQCEPVGTHLMKRNQSGKVVWAKSLVRYYPLKSEAPKCAVDSNDACARCGLETIRITSDASPRLLIPGGTVLIAAPEAVLRIRQEDGGMPAGSIPKTMRVIDTADVIKAKLELMQQQALAIKQCLKEGKKLKGSEKEKLCVLYRLFPDDDAERSQNDLARKLFLTD